MCYDVFGARRGLKLPTNMTSWCSGHSAADFSCCGPITNNQVVVCGLLGECFRGGRHFMCLVSSAWLFGHVDRATTTRVPITQLPNFNYKRNGQNEGWELENKLVGRPSLGKHSTYLRPTFWGREIYLL